jgi:hypothetical protein
VQKCHLYCTHALAVVAAAPSKEPDMNPANLSVRQTLPRWRAALALTALAGAAALVACGGGGGGSGGGTADAPAPSAGTLAVSYSQGPIEGFGSVVVGGVRFDESKAAVTDEDGVAHANTELKLGMVVQLDAGVVDHTAATAVALRVRFGSETIGPLGAVDKTASTVQVLGQTVIVTPSTVFDTALAGGLTALAALPAGSVVEVYGILDQASGKITATRIEAKAAATFYRLRGVVSALDTAAKTFKIGSELINYAGLAATAVPAGLANGQLLRVQVNTVQTAGAWVATRLGSGLRVPDATRDAHLEGAVTAFTSSTSFAVNGLAVDASAATFPDGSAGIALGARVEVTGSVSNGVLVATKVELEDKRTAGQRPLELHGDITALDATAKTFALRGMTVGFGSAQVAFKNGTAADLAVARRVDVYGVLSSDGTRVEARRIEFGN